MRSDSVGFHAHGPTPIQTSSARTRLSAAFFSTHNNNGRYIELDDLGVATSPVVNHNDLNDPRYASAPKKKDRKIYIPNTLWTRFFAVTGIIETLGTVGIESWVFISISKHFANHGNDSDSATIRLRSFLGLYIFALLYELVLSYDALRRKNTFQLMGLCICNMGLFIYGIIQTKEIKDTLNTLAGTVTNGTHLWTEYRVALILVPVVLAVGTIFMSFITWRLRAEFSWTIYKSISADLQMSWRYTTYQVYIAMLKFDFFFIFGTQLQVLLADRKITDQGFIVQAAMIPTAIVSLILAARFCRLEKKKSLIFMMVLMVLIIASFVNTLFLLFASSDGQQMKSYRVSLTLFASLAMLLLGLTLVNSVMCICNFNKGLKEHIEKSRKQKVATDPENSWTEDTKSRFVLN